jgi:DNA-binding NarL/FixJ family response regulator
VTYRILIADDQELVRKMLRTLLETRTDWKICAEAANGLEAVQKAAELKPDAIILDLAMPEMDGIHAAREILSNTPTVPILLHTNHAFSSLALEAKKNGIREVINKSISEQELVSAVEALLNERVAATGDGCIDKVPALDTLPTLDTLRDVTKLLEFDQLPDQDQQTPQKSEAK